MDLPFALSPVTVGLAAVLLFGRGGWFEPFFDSRGIQIMFALPAMVLVTIFISIPFTIREVQPVLEELGTDEEDASRTLGASVSQTFRKVTLPNIRWALLYGIALSTARAIGEIGAVLLVIGQHPGQDRDGHAHHLQRVRDTDNRPRATSWRSRWRRSPSSCWRAIESDQTQMQKGADQMTQPIVVEALTKRFGTSKRYPTSHSRRPRAPSPRCWGRAAPARAPSCA